MDKNTHGGARVGAGRPKGSTIKKELKKSFSISYKYSLAEVEKIKEILSKRAKKENISLSEALKKIVLEYEK